jgi:hypothetical protein
MAKVTASLSAQNTFTSSLDLVGHFNLSISGTFSATVTVQRSFDNTNWFDVDTFTSPIETYGFDPSQCYYRAGIKTGAYTSGTAVISLIDEPETNRSVRLA